jgi:DNA polymerase I
MTKILLAVDLSYQVYRAAAAHPNLTSGRHFTGGLYGFFATLSKMIRETQATHILFCKDTKPYRRSAEYPAYKQIRKKTADEDLVKMFKSSLLLVQGVLEGLGLPIYAVPGFESDDIIAHFAIRDRNRFNKIYLGSNDSDLFALLVHTNIKLYGKDLAGCQCAKTLMGKHGVTPQQYTLATALAGTHNDIEGIERVGLVTAIKAIKDPALYRALHEKHSALIKRNMGLIRLPHADFPPDFGCEHLAPGWFNFRTLYNLLGRYDIDATDDMVRSLSQLYR